MFTLSDAFLVSSSSGKVGWAQAQNLGLSNALAIEWTSFLKALSNVGLELSDFEDVVT